MDTEPALALVGTAVSGLFISVSSRTSYDVSLRVQFVQPGLSAEHVVQLSSEYGPTLETLRDFFAGMAEAWRGWEGERTFETLEHDFKITASHDGHVHLDVELRRWDGWSVRSALTLDAGEELSMAAAAIQGLRG